MAYVDRYPARGMAARVLHRMPVRIRVATGRQDRQPPITVEPVEELVGTSPDPAPIAPTEEWSEAALLETYEQAEEDPPADPELEALTSREIIRPKVVDFSRFIEAMRAKPRSEAPPAPEPRPIALSREECKRCGIPGFKGCAHQAPYEPPPAGH